MKRLLATTVALLAPGWLSAAGPAAVESSVVRIVNYSQRGDWYSPWDVSAVTPGVGSGFVVEGGLVLTNAHVVSDSRMLLLFLHNDPNPHPASVLRVGHDCDLALVRPEDDGLLKHVAALRLGGLPRLGSAVETFGYPMGGHLVSSTRGVVSRIAEQLYVHSGIDRHIAIQTDAAINPGNSGGPVVQEGRVVGVAFQALPDLQSIGYCIPTEVVERFLHDVADGRYDGYPDLGVSTSGLDNPAPRRKAGMADGETGARVDFVYPGSSADSLVREGDILLAVDGRPVANDESVAEDDRRFPFGLLVDRRQIGESITLRLLRAGERREVTVPLKATRIAASLGNVYDRLPRYFVYAGLVFVPLDREMLKTYGGQWLQTADRPLLYEYLFRPLMEPALFLDERVVLLRRLDHPVNANLSWYRNVAIERINGRRIGRLEDVVDALEKHAGDYHLIELSDFRRIEVLDRKAAERANEEILRRYGVPKDRRL
jgi:S1-C subfamily serine protease